MAYSLEIREELQATLTVDEMPRDVPVDTKIFAYLIGEAAKHKVGEANGTPEGEELNIDVTFDVDPGVYEVEVIEDGGPIVHPTDLPEKVRVLPTKAND